MLHSFLTSCFFIRNISQFGDGKFVLGLWDKWPGKGVFAIFYVQLASLEAKFLSTTNLQPTKSLREDTLIAINDSQGRWQLVIVQNAG